MLFAFSTIDSIKHFNDANSFTLLYNLNWNIEKMRFRERIRVPIYV